MANDGVLDYSMRNSNNYNNSDDQQPWREEIANDGVLDYSMRNINNNNDQQPLEKKKRHQINRPLRVRMEMTNKFIHSNKTKSLFAKEEKVGESSLRGWIKEMWMYFTPMPIHEIIVYVKNKDIPDVPVYRPSKKNELPRCSQKQQKQCGIKRCRSAAKIRSCSLDIDQNNQNLFDEQAGSLSEGNKLPRFSQKQQKQCRRKRSKSVAGFSSFSFGSEQNNQNLFDEQADSSSEGKKLPRFSQKQQKRRGRKRSRAAAEFKSSSLDINQNNQNLFDEQAGSSSDDTNLSQSSQQQQQWHEGKRFKSAEASLSSASTSGTSSPEPMLSIQLAEYLNFVNNNRRQLEIQLQARSMQLESLFRNTPADIYQGTLTEENRVTEENVNLKNIKEAIGHGEKLIEWLNGHEKPIIPCSMFRQIEILINDLKSIQEKRK